MKQQNPRRQQAVAGFVVPASVLLLVFFAYPLVRSIRESFYATSGGVETFAGLAQYQKLFGDPLVRKSFANAGLFLIIQVPIMISLAVFLAYCVHQSWLKFHRTFRYIYFLPAITTLVAYALVFRVLLTTNGGLVNQFLIAIGQSPIDWLNSPGWARVSVIAALTWRWTGYNMIIILAGLQAIPLEQFDSAALDGAKWWRTFRSIVIPQLRPVILFTTVTSTIATLQLFDENFILTQGGPNNATLTPILYLYRTAFRDFDFNYASAIAWVLVITIGLFSFIQFRLFKDDER
jgi:lactose/L-arabinose transport system permease protein